MDVSGGSPLLARQGGRRRIAPDIISVLDYEAGFGDSELVTFSERDLDVHLQTKAIPGMRSTASTDAVAQWRPNNLSSSQVSRPLRSCGCGRGGVAPDCPPAP
jgi:hypothetical protein